MKPMGTEKSLRILIIDDEDIVHQTIGEYLVQIGHEIGGAKDGLEAIDLMTESDFDLALMDIRMPRMDGMALLGRVREIQPEMTVVMITGHGTMDTAIQALRLGADDFLTKPIDLSELDAVLEKSRKIGKLRRDKHLLKETVKYIQSSAAIGGHRLIGHSKATKKVSKQIRLAVGAGCDTILITGETGTGKEVVAREIHALTDASDSPFIAVSCPALPDSLVESELFGHAKGSFTGATEERAGCFELANQGTLFLDEVGDLSAAAQAKMLRALETRTIRRIGGSTEVAVNVLVIAATNINLEEAVETGKFRRDLYYRLNLFTIEVRPLRDRREDILPLAQHFLMSFGGKRGIRLSGFTAEVEASLKQYNFPGNARELRNLVEKAAVLCGSGQIDTDHLQLPSSSQAPGEVAHSDHEHDRILLALGRARWNRRQAATILNMPYSTLRYKMKKFGID
jgi:DNA-binding NtrC family response regulator